MILLRGSPCPLGRIPFSLRRVRGRLLQIDRELAVAPEAGPWLDRAAELARPADPDPAHGARVALLAERLAMEVGWPAAAAEQLRRAAALHDIGKFALPLSLLLHPGPLQSSQRELLARHTHAAAWLLGGLRHPVLQLAQTVGRAHHERWDGGGYPDRMAGTDVPLPARIVAVCDVWDALTHARPYRPPVPADQAADAIRGMAGTALDPMLSAALLQLLFAPCPSSHPAST